jgi:hypothetical protein
LGSHPHPFFIQGDDRVERWVVPGNLRETCFEHLDGWYLALADRHC